MADYLVVHGISADVPSSSNTSPNSYFVDLLYNGQYYTTIKKNVPRWDETICFQCKRVQDDHLDDEPPSLEAKVYDSSSVLGTVLLPDDYFDRHPEKVDFISYPWKGTDSVLPHNSGGALVLKVFLAAADYVLLNLSNIVFATEDRYSKGKIVDQPPIALGPADAVLGEIRPNFEPGRVVERMQHLFVRVVKARKLPDMDANGSLDPYVEVIFGRDKSVTKCLKRNKNPEWNETFAFSFQHGKTPSPIVDVVVNDKDRVRDDFVGKRRFYVVHIPERSPDDIPLEPTWYPLCGEGGDTLAHASLLVAIWIGSQADEAYRRAFVSLYSPKVYETPRLWCLRLRVTIEGITAVDDATGVFCKACLGDLIQETRIGKRQTMASSGSYEWGEDLVFVAAEPFFESDLVVSVIKGNIIGTATIPLASIDKSADGDHVVKPNEFHLKNPAAPSSDMKFYLQTQLEGAYHIYDRQGYTDDTRPADRKLWNPPIGSVHLGILRTNDLTRSDVEKDDGTWPPKLKPYCVAKYGDKWVRTRTVTYGTTHGTSHVFNEQYTWDVYDMATVLNVGVFDQCTLEESGHRMIGKVRINLSCLETGRTYAHSYPLITLCPSGAMKTGELHLAVKITLASYANMVRSYAQPVLPRMQYVQPLTDEQQEQLRSQAAEILALRLSRMEQPLGSQVVACMCDTKACSSWSLRKMKVNYTRLMRMVSPFIDWFRDVRSWQNPTVTLLAHAIFVLVLWFPKLVLLCGALVAVWIDRFRQDHFPPFVDYNLSQIGTVDPDELEEEFDNTMLSSCSDRGLTRLRYERLRAVAGMVQTAMDDLASRGEKIQSLVSWTDPKAAALFYLFVAMIAVVVYLVPLKVLVALAGFYVMRHPRFRTMTPSIFHNFFERLPCRRYDLL